MKKNKKHAMFATFVTSIFEHAGWSQLLFTPTLFKFKWLERKHHCLAFAIGTWICVIANSNLCCWKSYRDWRDDCQVTPLLKCCCEVEYLSVTSQTLVICISKPYYKALEATRLKNRVVECHGCMTKTFLSIYLFEKGSSPSVIDLRQI